MFTIAVCDDDALERDALKPLIERWGKDQDVKLVLSDFSSPGELLDAVKENGGFSLYLLDVLMPEMDGIALGKRLKNLDPHGLIAYLTTSADFAVESYALRAFHYLMKPISAEKLNAMFTEALALSQNKAGKKLLIHSKEGDILLSSGNIDYVESSARFPHYVTKNGTVRGMMLTSPFREEMSELLSEPSFFLCGASFLINLAHVRAVEKAGVLFSGGKRLSLPRTPLKELRIAWTNYWLDNGRG